MNDIDTAINAWLDRRCQHSARWFVETHRPIVRRVIARWLPNEHLIEDVMQETFIKAFRSMHRLLPGGNIAGWLACIARNTCANHLRDWRRNLVRAATDCGIEDYSEMLVTHDPLPEDRPTIERRFDMLLSPLQHQDRRVLTLYHLENRTARDVGQQLGLSEGNVRIRLMRSHRALRDHASAMRVAGLL